MRRIPLAGLTLSAFLTACSSQPSPGEAATGAALSAQSREPVKLTYTNPLQIVKPDGSKVESCADPSIIHSQVNGDSNWYLYCTTDPHNLQDTDAAGNLKFHLISMAKSSDLVHWNYIGDAFTQKPGWVADNAGLWAPDIEYLNGKYYLYYTASDTKAGGSAIGVATSDSPSGPWTDSGTPVVESDGRWTFDPDVLVDQSGQAWIYYGSYYGGIRVRKLSADGLRSDPASQVLVALDNRYEGTQVIFRNGYYYLMASATDCCRGPLTGYSVFAGRSTSPTGPFVDQQGVSLLDSRVGGTPVISMNGNRWVGPGHHAVFTDEDGQDWVVYHAVDQQDPYFTPGGINKRPALLDPLDWVNGWPTVRDGRWASDEPMPAPAAQPGQKTKYHPNPPFKDRNEIKKLLTAYSDPLSGTTLSSAWTWVRPPASGVSLSGSTLNFATQAADLYVDSNSASVLTRPAPNGDYAVQVKVRMTVPQDGCCFNYVQGGLVIYGDDDNFLKLAVVSIWNTRQIEWAKELAPVADNYPRYGNTVLSAPGETTWLRIVRRTAGDHETYTAYSSLDGTTWVRGGTWTHTLGVARIGLVSMGGSGFESQFSDLRVYSLKP